MKFKGNEQKFEKESGILIVFDHQQLQLSQHVSNVLSNYQHHNDKPSAWCLHGVFVTGYEVFKTVQV